MATDGMLIQHYASSDTSNIDAELWVEVKFERVADDPLDLAFLCDFIIPAIESLEILEAPELVGLEVPEDIDLEASCQCALGGSGDCG